MPHDEFLRLLQATEAQRRCEGKDCLPITNVHVTTAEAIERIRVRHRVEEPHMESEDSTCETCETGRKNTIALRESMHAQGIDFPVDVFPT